MDNVATETTQARAQRSTSQAAEWPRLPITGTNAELDDFIRKSEAALYALAALDDAENEALDAAVDAARSAICVILSFPVTREEAPIRLHAYLMAEAMLWTPDEQWRAFTPDEAAAVLAEEDRAEELGRALRVFRADLAQVPPPPSAGSVNPDLAAAIAALEAAKAAEKAPGAAHDAAEEAVMALKKDASATSEQIRIAQEAESRAEAAFEEAYERTEELATALLDVPVNSFDELVLKLNVYASAFTCGGVETLPFLESATAALGAMQRDMTRLLDPCWPAPPPETPGPGQPDADLLALGAAFEAAWEAQRTYDIRGGDEGYEALCDVTRAIGQRILSVRATTIDGLRVKARVAQECQGDSPDEPFELIAGDDVSDSRVAASIVNDLLGLAERPLAERMAEDDAIRAAERAYRSRGMAATAESPEWVRAVARYRLAKADDAMLLQAAEAADDAIEAEVPVPAELRFSSDDDRHLTADMIADAPAMTEGQKANLQGILQRYLHQLDEARARHGWREAHDAWEASVGGWHEFKAMMRTPAPTVQALAEKVRLYIDEVFCTEIGDAMDTQDTLARLLADDGDTGAAWPVLIYQDLLRLDGESPDLANVKAFDPEHAVEALRAAGVEVWPGVGWSYPAGFGPAQQAALAALTTRQQDEVIAYAAASAAQEDLAAGIAAEEERRRGFPDEDAIASAPDFARERSYAQGGAA